jgi:hypothetical protein
LDPRLLDRVITNEFGLSRASVKDWGKHCKSTGNPETMPTLRDAVEEIAQYLRPVLALLPQARADVQFEPTRKLFGAGAGAGAGTHPVETTVSFHQVNNVRCSVCLALSPSDVRECERCTVACFEANM